MRHLLCDLPLQPFYLGVLVCVLALGACRDSPGKLPASEAGPEAADPIFPDPVVPEEAVKTPPSPALESLADTTFIRLADYSGDFAYDLRYATENNFLKAAVYPCAECYTRVKTARALLAANSELMRQGYRIRFFDCYRPNSVQYQRWAIVPNPQYVANPVKGSIHNKGGAVDITLETLEGVPLDMGTDFDYFGRPAYHDHTDLPGEVLANRRLLKETMERHGFWSIRTEWWHYNLKAGSADPVADFQWPCPADQNP